MLIRKECLYWAFNCRHSTSAYRRTLSIGRISRIRWKAELRSHTHLSWCGVSVENIRRQCGCSILMIRHLVRSFVCRPLVLSSQLDMIYAQTQLWKRTSIPSGVSVNESGTMRTATITVMTNARCSCRLNIKSYVIK
jgi:hypothetical protein